MGDALFCAVTFSVHREVVRTEDRLPDSIASTRGPTINIDSQARVMSNWRYPCEWNAEARASSLSTGKATLQLATG